VLCFIDETRECLFGKLTKGDVMDGVGSGNFFASIRALFPGSVQKVLLRAHRELFCTTLQGKPFKSLAKYDKMADPGDLIEDAKRQGLDAIPSPQFKINYAFFHFIMPVYNPWRHYKPLSQENNPDSEDGDLHRTIQDHTIRIARLKIFLTAAGLPFSNDRDQEKFSVYETRAHFYVDVLKIAGCYSCQSASMDRLPIAAMRFLIQAFMSKRLLV
jgi:hypothetical protein